jgi:hypothetical protein
VGGILLTNRKLVAVQSLQNGVEVMSAIKSWELLPSGSLADQKHWRSVGSDRYAALRMLLLIIKSNGKVSRLGPIISEHNVSPEDTVVIRRKVEQVITYSTTLTQAIKYATTSRVGNRLSAKLAAELGAKALGFSGKLNSEILSKTEYDITSVAESVLSTETSHTIQETKEDEHNITLNGGSNLRVAQLRRRYFPRQWDFYLHSYEYLELTYKRRWIWGDVRKTIKKTESGSLGWPLVSVIFYEPQLERDVCYHPIENELENPESFEIQTPMLPMSRSTAPELDSLESLAKLAFPVTPLERSRAARLREYEGATPRHSYPGTGSHRSSSGFGSNRFAAKKSSVRKTAAKKATRKVAKRFATKATMKKASRKTTMKKAPSKRTPSKRW